MFNNIFLKSWRLWGNVEKYCTAAGQATDDNMAHVHYMLDNCGYTHSLRTGLCNNAFLLQQWLHERTSLLRLYVHCVSCLGRLRTVPLLELHEQLIYSLHTLWPYYRVKSVAVLEATLTSAKIYFSKNSRYFMRIRTINSITGLAGPARRSYILHWAVTCFRR